MQQVKTRRWWYQGQPPVKALLILPSNVFVLQETKKGDDLVTLKCLRFDAKDVFELGLDRAKNHHKRKSIFQRHLIASLFSDALRRHIRCFAYGGGGGGGGCRG
ncbi:hypothetical protein E3N88_09725 [Mikania micrantha]|uniref:Uncharacterized protein n=1 Tax=Mikania micrantha TaxID=192012 RepID=A0A5N6PJU8_9ASTR|nr:hypothetical protein E3N88_09725 [Mikania micrantha]